MQLLDGNKKKHYHCWLLQHRWKYNQDAHVYPYRDPWHKLSTYTYDDAIELQHFRLTPSISCPRQEYNYNDNGTFLQCNKTVI